MRDFMELVMMKMKMKRTEIKKMHTCLPRSVHHSLTKSGFT